MKIRSQNVKVSCKERTHGVNHMIRIEKSSAKILQFKVYPKFKYITVGITTYQQLKIT